MLFGIDTADGENKSANWHLAKLIKHVARRVAG
jgi:hypothetical protein